MRFTHPEVDPDASTEHMVLMYPDPTDPVGPTGDVFEVHDATGRVLVSDTEVRDHPEVLLTLVQRDAVVRRLGYVRTGPWSEEAGGQAQAPVR
ncbi:hypothetical protein AB1388_11500 [Streptomyces hydrogenans]|uniref:hypothetical protein n=1 Tax=Streptomyces hydrogenans TaxID=1873719 RepID=UPI00345D2301